MIYFDTSALIKRFVVESGSDFVQRLILQEELIATSKITYAEVYSGLARKLRSGELAPKDYETAVGQFESDWETYIRLDLHDEVLDTTRELIQRYGLRAFDVIHLGSAIDLRKALGEPVDFVAADKRLLEAATAEQLGSIDVEDGVAR